MSATYRIEKVIHKRAPRANAAQRASGYAIKMNEYIFETRFEVINNETGRAWNSYTRKYQAQRTIDSLMKRAARKEASDG
jgi:hypothetical protein